MLCSIKSVVVVVVVGGGGEVRVLARVSPRPFVYILFAYVPNLFAKMLRISVPSSPVASPSVILYIYI